MGNVKYLENKQWFVYDKKTQESMSNYAKFLIESGLQYEETQENGEPECHCLIAAGNSNCYIGAEEYTDVETNDIESLMRMVAALEEAKFKALNKIQYLRTLLDE